MTELHAFGPVGTAFGKTRKLLLEPFDVWLWVKLIIITFFVASGTGSFNPGSNLQYSMSRADLNNLPNYDISHALSDSTIIALVLLVIVAAAVLALIMSYLRGVFAFVLIDALSTGSVRIVGPFKENMGRGFKVFLFNVAVAIVSIVVIGVIVAAMILAILWAIGGGDWRLAATWDSISPLGLFVVIAAIILGLLAILACSLVIGLIVGFFYDFAVPLMYFKGTGLRQSIGQVWSLVRHQPLQFLVYVVVRWALEVVIAIVMGIVYLFIFAIFFAAGIILLIAFAGAAKTSLLLALPFAAAILVGILLLVIVAAFLSMPVQVYLRYYSLDFLRSFDPSFVVYTKAQSPGKPMDGNIRS